MQKFSLERLQRAQRRAGSECFLRELRQEMRANQRKITKSVYNLESRDISKFTREWNQMRMKFRGAPSELQLPRPKAAKQTSLTYDENQNLEMSFQIPFRLKPKVNESAPIRTESIQQSQQESKIKPLNQIKTVKNRYSLKMGSERVKLSSKTGNNGNNREKTQYMSSSKGSRREARQRFVTQWDPDFKDPKDSQRVSLKKVESPPHAQENLMADLSRQRIDHYARNLHRLEWSSRFLKQHSAPDAEESPQFREHLRKFKCDLDNPIDEQAINYMVSRRYNMLTHYLEDSYEKRNKQLSDYSPSFKSKEQESEGSLLDSLTHKSILKLMKVASPPAKKYKRQASHQTTKQQSTPNTLAFSLPYCEFISFRQTRSSIYQLISMGNRTSLKLAFTIYDKNRNGLLDEDDLLQMISLSRTFAFVEADIVMIARVMSNKNKNLASSPQSSERTEKQSVTSLADSGVSKKSKERNRQGQVSSAFSPIEEEQESDVQSPSNALPSGRFKIDKLYTFLRGKEAEQKKGQGKIVSYTMKPLNFEQFCKAFRNERPMIIIDLFQFLFGAPLDHFHPNVKKIFSGLQSKKKISPPSLVKQDETIDEKWSQRIRKVNAILQSFVKPDK